jgi:hypothetical protein
MIASRNKSLITAKTIALVARVDLCSKKIISPMAN